MLITVDRFVSDSETTISHVSVDGQFICFGLEDEFRTQKVKGETRIPAGRYKIGVRREGGFHQRYAARFADMHEGMLHVLDVPNFQFILIHVGNTQKDTEGCLLVGMNAQTQPGAMRVNSSVAAYRKLYPIVIGAAKAGDLEILYLDNDLPTG